MHNTHYRRSKKSWLIHNVIPMMSDFVFVSRAHPAH
jgi:hypothetical protein